MNPWEDIVSVLEHRYLIIGGAPKAGTTSLYKWLADHPEVCASSLKETRFFLDADYPLPYATRFDGTNIQEYADFFKHCRAGNRLLRLDATPDYLYSKTALRIAELLPQAKIVFILRDPVERMVSWYKYALQRGLLSTDTSFEDYVMAQVGHLPTNDTPIHLRALEQCRYEKYLPAFRQAFGERCMVIDFKDLKADARNVMTKISAFAGLDDSFFDTYTFRAENVSQAVRIRWLMWGYYAIRRRLVHAVYDNSVIRELLKKPNRIIKNVLLMNVKEAELVRFSAEIAELIRHEAWEITITDTPSNTVSGVKPHQYT